MKQYNKSTENALIDKLANLAFKDDKYMSMLLKPIFELYWIEMDDTITMDEKRQQVDQVIKQLIEECKKAFNQA